MNLHLISSFLNRLLKFYLQQRFLHYTIYSHCQDSPHAHPVKNWKSFAEWSAMNAFPPPLLCSSLRSLSHYLLPKYGSIRSSNIDNQSYSDIKHHLRSKGNSNSSSPHELEKPDLHQLAKSIQPPPSGFLLPTVTNLPVELAKLHLLFSLLPFSQFI